MTAAFHPSRDFRRARDVRRAVGSVPAPRPRHTSSSSGADAPNYLVRRVVAVVVAVAVLAAAAVMVGTAVGALSDLGGRPAAASEVSGAAVAPALHVAEPGDTLWSIAGRYRGGIDRDRYIDALISLNGTSDILAGQAIRLP